MGEGNMMIAILCAFIAMMVIQSRNQKKEKLAFQDWLNGLKKNDRIITKGGIHGIITSVKDDAIVIKIDEDKGIKMTISKDAIAVSLDDRKDDADK
jgi:preprotein translocase subunit YajC